MEKKPRTRTEDIITGMYILAWLALIGYYIKAGTILINFIFSWANPDMTSDTYQKLNLEKLRELNFGYYAIAVVVLAALAVMKAYMWQLVVKTLSKISMMNPFTRGMAQRLEMISYVLVGTWVLGAVYQGYMDWLEKNVGVSAGTSIDNESLYVAGLVFVISQIFKRGVEIQSENELTV